MLRLADRGAKRALDVLVAGGLLLILVPLIALASILIVVDSPGGAFFRCERAGFRGRRLRDAQVPQDARGRQRTRAHDGRRRPLHPHRPWLAKFKLDEVPQLWHVVRGEMSLVGPRPEDPSFVERHGSAYDHILSVRPGITGLSQLAFAEESRILDDDDPLGHYVDRLLPQKVNLDRLYASQRTLLLDIKILTWTVAAVILRRQVAVHRGTGRMNLRKR